MKRNFEPIEFNYNYLRLEGANVDISKSTGLGELIYKSKDLLGMNDTGILLEEKGIKKNINIQNHKILNIFIQTLHNTIYREPKSRYKFYKNTTENDDNYIYIKLDIKDLMYKIGFSATGKNILKDVRFFKDSILSMQGMYKTYFSDENKQVQSSISYFNKISVDMATEEIFVSFKDELVRPILNNYKTHILSDSNNGYVTIPVTKIQNSKINSYAIMLYEYISCNIYNCTINNTAHDLEYFFRFLNNDNYKKFSQKFERVFTPAIESLETDMGLKVFYIFEKTLGGKSVKNVRLKVYKTNNYKKLEKSEALDKEIPHVSVIGTNTDIFKLNDLILMGSINNLDAIYESVMENKYENFEN